MRPLPHCAKDKIKGGGETSLGGTEGLGTVSLPTIPPIEPASYILIV
jgi:hypothetical protein